MVVIPLQFKVRAATLQDSVIIHL